MISVSSTHLGLQATIRTVVQVTNECWMASKALTVPLLSELVHAVGSVLVLRLVFDLYWHESSWSVWEGHRATSANSLVVVATLDLRSKI